jgi:hypothetical protein
MARTPKEASKNGQPKEAKEAPAPKSAPKRQDPPPSSDDPQALVQAARAETMRAQRDLESVRLELEEQKRKSSQRALVQAEELKEARAEREQLRMQIVALKGEIAELTAPGKKRNPKKEQEEDGRIQELEKELSEVLQDLQKERAQVGRLQKANAETAAVLAEARRELESRPPPIRLDAPPPGQVSATPPPMQAELDPPAALAPPPEKPAEPVQPTAAASAPPAEPPQSAPEKPRGIFSKLFGRRAQPG